MNSRLANGPLIFACCHPDLPEQAQVALALRAVFRLSTAEIAAAFLVSEPTTVQRLVHAKRPSEPAGPDELGERLPTVLAVVYPVFNEGYLASGRVTPQRRGLAREALALHGR
jgi:predicted RNA polymerase sigma factor